MKLLGISQRFWMLAVTFLGILSFSLFWGVSTVFASAAIQEEPPGPDRYTTKDVDVVLYQWWLIAWEDNEIHCTVFIEHEGLPTADDVYNQCGAKMHDQWIAKSKPCAEEDITACKGYYWLLVNQHKVIRKVPVKLPAPQVWLSVVNCEPDRRGWCTQQPSLLLVGEETLENNAITRIEGLVGNSTFRCDGSSCSFLLSETDPGGVPMSFWAYSSYGDSSEVFTAQISVTSYTSVSESALLDKWYVYVLSPQWTGAPTASCAQVWGTFPPVDGVPPWLETPETSAALQSNIPYAYLAGNLIAQGAVDVSSCSDGGLLPGGTASTCGLEVARPVVEAWQNRFDELIFSVAGETDVPAQLLKNLFSRESQFWPGVFRNGEDTGLGQLTEDGADVTLMWNSSFYQQFCPLVLDETTCRSRVYSPPSISDANHLALNDKQRAMLRGALVRSVDASCADCPLGIDLARADFSVAVFARTLLANCAQAGATVSNAMEPVNNSKIYDKTLPAKWASYEDMWKFTLVNYNAGTQCLHDALELARGQSTLTWDSVSPYLEQLCPGSAGYVNDITK